MVKAIENHSDITIKEVRKIVPNKNNDQQLRYYSTKKKRESIRQMGKPTLGEFRASAQNLDKVDVLLCGYCHKEDDESISEKVMWVVVQSAISGCICCVYKDKDNN